MKFQKILIAVDDSAHSLKAAKLGFALARELKSELAIIYVVDQTLEVTNPDIGMTREQSRSALRKEAEKTIDQMIKMYEHDISVLKFIPEGLPGQSIIEIAIEWMASVIVMGNHPKSGLGRMMTRSVTDYVMTHTAIPVLLAPVDNH